MENSDTADVTVTPVEAECTAAVASAQDTTPSGNGEEATNESTTQSATPASIETPLETEVPETKASPPENSELPAESPKSSDGPAAPSSPQSAPVLPVEIVPQAPSSAPETPTAEAPLPVAESPKSASEPTRESTEEKKSPTSADQKAAADGENKLKQSWTLYTQSKQERGHSQDSFANSFQSEGDFTDYTKFWAKVASIDVAVLPTNYNIKVFKTPIRPLWEDPANKKGGKYGIQVFDYDVADKWKKLMHNLVTESVDVTKVCGAVLARFESQTFKLMVWTTEQLSKEELKSFENVDLQLKFYKPHQESVQSNKAVEGPKDVIHKETTLKMESGTKAKLGAGPKQHMSRYDASAGRQIEHENERKDQMKETAAGHKTPFSSNKDDKDDSKPFASSQYAGKNQSKDTQQFLAALIENITKVKNQGGTLNTAGARHNTQSHVPNLTDLKQGVKPEVVAALQAAVAALTVNHNTYLPSSSSGNLGGGRGKAPLAGFGNNAGGGANNGGNAGHAGGNANKHSANQMSSTALLLTRQSNQPAGGGAGGNAGANKYGFDNNQMNRQHNAGGNTPNSNQGQGGGGGGGRGYGKRGPGDRQFQHNQQQQQQQQHHNNHPVHHNQYPQPQQNQVNLPPQNQQPMPHQHGQHPQHPPPHAVHQQHQSQHPQQGQQPVHVQQPQPHPPHRQGQGHQPPHQPPHMHGQPPHHQPPQPQPGQQPQQRYNQSQFMAHPQHHQQGSAPPAQVPQQPMQQQSHQGLYNQGQKMYNQGGNQQHGAAQQRHKAPGASLQSPGGYSADYSQQNVQNKRPIQVPQHASPEQTYDSSVNINTNLHQHYHTSEIDYSWDHNRPASRGMNDQRYTADRNAWNTGRPMTTNRKKSETTYVDEATDDGIHGLNTYDQSGSYGHYDSAPVHHVPPVNPTFSYPSNEGYYYGQQQSYSAPNPADSGYYTNTPYANHQQSSAPHPPTQVPTRPSAPPQATTNNPYGYNYGGNPPQQPDYQQHSEPEQHYDENMYYHHGQYGHV